MRLIYGTKNVSKIRHMNKIVNDIVFEIVGLDKEIKDAPETGQNLRDNAKEKALHYYNILKQPVFSCDSGLYFDHLNEEDQPGIHIRRVNGQRLTDDEMIEHYAQIAKDNGGEAVARYRNAICLIIDENNIIVHDGDELASEPFFITSKPHPTRLEGFPLDSLSVEIESGDYYYDIKNYLVEESRMNEGFKSFFNKHFIRPIVKMKFKGFDELTFELYPEYAPETVKNFISHIHSGYYLDKALCRIVPNRLIQSGDPSLGPVAWTDDTPGYILDGEFNREGCVNPLSFIKGTLGMAMAGYEITPYATAGSFFVMNKDEAKLDDIVPAFGRLISDLKVIDDINKVPTHTRYGYDAPDHVIPLESISVNTFGFVYPEPKKVSHDVLNPKD